MQWASSTRFLFIEIFNDNQVYNQYYLFDIRPENINYPIVI